jgi:predicted phosphodiesterase
MLSFVHLSDIHFNKYSGDAYDVNNDLRNMLLADVKENYHKSIENCNGILICGDIAFSGKENEYDIASEFLKILCDILGLSGSSVYCVPGNHDVDQAVPRSEYIIESAQRELATSTMDDFDASLAKIAHSERSAELLYEPIKNYNKAFAGKFNCNLNSKNLCRDFIIDLDFKYKLSIWCINSTLISNHHDHDDRNVERSMRIGRVQMPVTKKNTIYLSICHHPPQCWFDPEKKLAEKMNQRVALQLYGHKHIQTIERKGESIIIGSGATQPARGDSDWLPRYNWITLETKQDKLFVSIYPRVLDNYECRFEADPILGGKKLCETFELNLNEEPDKGPRKKLDEEPDLKADDLTITEPVAIAETEGKYSRRDLIYSFLMLPYYVRLKIISMFNLGRPEDEEKQHADIVGYLIDRAKENNQLDQLYREIQKEIKGEK